MNLLPRDFFFDNDFDDFVPSKSNVMKCDIYEKDDNYHIEMDIPGFEKKDINIEINDDYLTISAFKDEEQIDEDKNYIRKERKYGKYERSFYVGNIDATDIEAEFKEGVLEIVIPKRDELINKKTIEIK